MRTVIIFRDELLPLSETFVMAQASDLKEFHPRFAGIHRAPNGLSIPQDSLLLMRSDSFFEKLKRQLFFRTGFAPGFLHSLERERPVLMHAHFGLDGAIALPLVAKLRIPLVVTLHGFDVTTSAEQLRRSLSGQIYSKGRERLWRSASLFICVSEFIRYKAREAGFPESKLVVHYIGVNDSFQPPPSPSRDRNLVLFVGRLIEKKGCAYLIQAMEDVKRRIPQAKLVVIGGGPLRPSLEALATSKGIECQFLGGQPSEAVHEWLGRARVLCAPSITAKNGDSEGCPIILAEAQGMGVPVVSSFHSGIPEVVRHGETGLLATEQDIRKLSEHLIRYLTDDSFWQACSERAAAWIRTNFNLRIQNRKLEQIYRQVLSTQN